MKNIVRAKSYQKKLYNALGKKWNEEKFRKYWEGGILGSEWDLLYDQKELENDFCAWCGNDELKSDYYRSPSFSTRGVRVPICDDCFIEETGGNTQFQNRPSKSGCFIATAALGNPFDPSIILLKRYRDEYLLKTLFGRVFVYLYYIFSPPIANIISKSDTLRLFVRRKIITQIVKKIRKKYDLK